MEGYLEVTETIQGMLSSGSEIIKIEDYYRIPAVIVSDLDGDGNVEVLVGYKNINNNNEDIYVSVFKSINEQWILIDTIIGKGIGISDFLTASVETPSINNLVIGWKIDRKKSKLSIYKLVGNKLTSILNQNVYYSKLEVEDMKGKNGRDDLYEFAIWEHDKLDAYDIKLYKFKNGKLIRNDDLSQEYFKGIANYYLGLIETQGANPVYLYHLATSELKSGNFKGAINTLNVLVQLDHPYPSKSDVIDLLNEVNKKAKS